MGSLQKLTNLILQSEREFEINKCLKKDPSQREIAVETMYRIVMQKAGSDYDPVFVRQCILLEICNVHPVNATSSSAPTVREYIR